MTVNMNDDLKTVLEFMFKYGDELEQRFKYGGKAYAAALRLAGEAEVAEMTGQEAEPSEVIPIIPPFWDRV